MATLFTQKTSVVETYWSELKGEEGRCFVGFDGCIHCTVVSWDQPE